MFDAKNYFEIFGLPISFEIDQKLLHQNYIKLQQILHPDKSSNKSHLEKKFAIEYSAKLNQAHETLHDDKKRAEYLLSLHNIIINMEEGNNINPDPIMLNEILELNEDPQAADIEALKQECWDNFCTNYHQHKFIEAAQAIIKLQYLTKIL